MKQLFWFTILIGIIGCDDAPKKKEAAAPAAATSPAPSSALVLSIQSEAIPNRYHVSLRWPNADAGKFALVVSRESRHDGLIHIATLAPEAIAFEDLNVAAGEHYTYFLSRKTDMAHELVAKREISVPRDTVVEGRRLLPALSSTARLFLRAETELHVGGGRREIEVEELHSDGAILRSFEEGSRAAEGAAGSAAEPILLRAKRATGKLSILANGQHGGMGWKGATGIAGKAGTAGTAAVLAFVGKWANPLLREFLVRELEKMSRDLSTTDPKWREVYGCATRPGNGGMGEPGTQGARGGKGGKGGATPLVYVRVENPDAFEVEVIPVPGTGGLGGEGGDGGPGGPGGAAGERDNHEICPPATPGPQGMTGKKGDSGPENTAADAGSLSPYCLELGDARFGQCEAVRRELLISK